MIKEMLSHIIYSLYLAHLEPCDNIAIDLNLLELGNSIVENVNELKTCL